MIYTYLKKFQDDPTSRVFAPLAESYRKAGLVDEAIQVAREGLRVHPNFMGGRVALARALFDKKLYQEVIDELSPIVQDIPDNLVAQKLLGESYLMLGRMPEALSAYKMLLYFSPHDPDAAKLVQELESKAYEGGILVLRTDPIVPPEFREKPANEAIQGDLQRVVEEKIKKIESLQVLLQKVERYRTLLEVSAR